jgi:glycosyltransferase involved in cell wall biosynthesis
MRIGIDTFSFDSPGENSGVGPGVYVWSLLPELIRAGAHHHFVIFANKETQGIVPSSPNVTKVVCPGPNRLRPYRILHEQIYLPIQFLRFRLDVLHFMGNNIAYLLARRSVLTVYDLMWAYYLNRGDSAVKYKYFALTVPLSLRKARALITISHFVADQVKERFRGITQSVFPIYLAPGKLVEPSQQEILSLNEKYQFPFIFSVTTPMPHKNLQILLEAFTRLKQDSLFPGKLVVAGQLRGSFMNSTEEFIRANQLSEDVVLTGFISDQEKTYCYRTTSAFVYPSLYEGFGLPILEAMQSGAPVIASNAASMPEVGGDACLYFNPNSVNDLVVSIVAILNDNKIRNLCIARGFDRCQNFSWAETARHTIAVYEKTFHDGVLKAEWT